MEPDPSRWLTCAPLSDVNLRFISNLLVGWMVGVGAGSAIQDSSLGLPKSCLTAASRVGPAIFLIFVPLRIPSHEVTQQGPRGGNHECSVVQRVRTAGNTWHGEKDSQSIEVSCVSMVGSAFKVEQHCVEDFSL